MLTEAHNLLDADVSSGVFIDRMKALLVDIAKGTMESDPSVLLRFYAKLFAHCIKEDYQLNQLHNSKVILTYKVAYLQLATHFITNSRHLCKNILKVLQTRSLPPLEHFPRIDQLFYSYYGGLYHYYENHNAEAHDFLSKALSLCPPTTPMAQKIMQRLLPLQLYRNKYPSRQIMTQFPFLKHYKPLFHALSSGNIKAYDDFMVSMESSMVRQETLGSYEALKVVVWRNLIRQVYHMVQVDAQLPLPIVLKAIECATDKTDTRFAYHWLAMLSSHSLMRANIYLDEACMVFDPNNPFPVNEM